MSDPNDEIITQAMLLGAEFTAFGAHRTGTYWCARSADGVGTGHYIHKHDAARKYLAKRGFEANILGELQGLSDRRKSFLYD
jgi:hypothetical protein